MPSSSTRTSSARSATTSPTSSARNTKAGGAASSSRKTPSTAPDSSTSTTCTSTSPSRPSDSPSSSRPNDPYPTHPITHSHQSLINFIPLIHKFTNNFYSHEHPHPPHAPLRRTPPDGPPPRRHQADPRLRHPLRPQAPLLPHRLLPTRLHHLPRLHHLSHQLPRANRFLLPPPLPRSVPLPNHRVQLVPPIPLPQELILRVIPNQISIPPHIVNHFKQLVTLNLQFLKKMELIKFRIASLSNWQIYKVVSVFYPTSKSEMDELYASLYQTPLNEQEYAIIQRYIPQDQVQEFLYPAEIIQQSIEQPKHQIPEQLSTSRNRKDNSVTLTTDISEKDRSQQLSPNVKPFQR